MRKQRFEDMKAAIDAEITKSLEKCADAKSISEFERMLRPPVIEYVERKLPTRWHFDRKTLLQLLQYANGRLEEELNRSKARFKPATTSPKAKKI